MVTVFLRGGLGNQMFQYAAGLALAKRNGTELLLDSVFLSDRWPRKNFSYRTFDLDIFSLVPTRTLLSRAAESFPIPGVWLGVDIVAMKASSAFGLQKVIKEKKEFYFDPQVATQKGNVTLWGRWQNEKYFADSADEVRRAFAFKIPLTGDAAQIAERIRSSHSVAVHIRRGDYAALKNVVTMMGDTDLSYYERAVAHIAARVPEPALFVFSDDVEWCQKNLSLPATTTYVPASAAGPKAAFHLELMSLCKHAIVANSTFSWWGAWLNRNPEKIVVAPKKWYADGRDEGNEIMPESWIKL